MGVTASILSTVVGAAATVYSSDQQRKASNKATDAQKAMAAATPPPVKTQDAVNPNATRNANASAAMAGIPGTLLTGVSGVNPNSLNTGKTLLGG